MISSTLWDLGTTGIFEDGDELIAGFQSESQARAVAERIVLHHPGTVVRAVEPAPTAADLAGEDPVREVIVRPADDGADEPVVVRVRTGGAFGHGGHPTTRLALDHLARSVRPGDRVLDVGTGTGVLALAARALGADRVVGTDIDLAAVAVAEANAAIDGLDDAVHVGPWSIPEAVGILGGSPDVLVINVLLTVHRELAPAVAAAAAGTATVITAGYLRSQAAEVASLYRPLGQATARDELDGWVADRFGPAPQPPG